MAFLGHGAQHVADRHAQATRRIFLVDVSPVFFNVEVVGRGQRKQLVQVDLGLLGRFLRFGLGAVFGGRRHGLHHSRFHVFVNGRGQPVLRALVFAAIFLGDDGLRGLHFGFCNCIVHLIILLDRVVAAGIFTDSRPRSLLYHIEDIPVNPLRRFPGAVKGFQPFNLTPRPRLNHDVADPMITDFGEL